MNTVFFNMRQLLALLLVITVANLAEANPKKISSYSKLYPDMSETKTHNKNKKDKNKKAKPQLVKVTKPKKIALKKPEISHKLTAKKMIPHVAPHKTPPKKVASKIKFEPTSALYQLNRKMSKNRAKYLKEYWNKYVEKPADSRVYKTTKVKAVPKGKKIDNRKVASEMQIQLKKKKTPKK